MCVDDGDDGLDDTDVDNEDDDVDVLSEDNTDLAEIEVLFCETVVVIAPIGDWGERPGRAGAGGLYADDGGPYA